MVSTEFQILQLGFKRFARIRDSPYILRKIVAALNADQAFSNSGVQITKGNASVEDTHGIT